MASANDSISGGGGGNEDHGGRLGGSSSTYSISSNPILRKNAPGNRSDVGWKYGAEFEGNPKKIVCKFCKKVITGGIYRFKHHLAKTQKDTDGCISVPPEVQKEMLEVLTILEEKSIKKRTMSQERDSLIEDVEEDEDVRGKRQAIGGGKNPKLDKKKQMRKQKDYSIDDLSSDDEWIVEKNEASGGDEDGDEDDLDDLGSGVGSSSTVDASVDDLEIPNWNDEFDRSGHASDGSDEGDDDSGMKYKSLNDLLD